MLVRGGDVTLTAFRPQSPTCNFGSFPWVPLPRQQQYKPRQTWKERNDNNKTRNSFSFFLFFRKEELPLLHDWRETEEGYAERGDGRLGQQTRGDCCLQRSSSLVRFRLLRRARRKKKKKEKKQKGEINGEDLQQRHNVNTQRYAVLLAQAKETRLLVFTISSLSLFLCSPHFSSSSSSSFKSLRIRMRFAVLSFLTFSCCRDGRAFKSLSLSSC